MRDPAFDLFQRTNNRSIGMPVPVNATTQDSGRTAGHERMIRLLVSLSRVGLVDVLFSQAASLNASSWSSNCLNILIRLKKKLVPECTAGIQNQGYVGTLTKNVSAFECSSILYSHLYPLSCRSGDIRRQQNTPASHQPDRMPILEIYVPSVGTTHHERS